MNNRLTTPADRLAIRRARHRRDYLQRLRRKHDRLLDRVLPVLATTVEALEPGEAFALLFGRLKAAKNAARSAIIASVALGMWPFSGARRNESASVPQRTLHKGRRGKMPNSAHFRQCYEAGLLAAQNLRVTGYLAEDAVGFAYFSDSALAALFTGIRPPRELRRQAYLVNLVAVEPGTTTLAFHACTLKPLFQFPLPKRVVQELEKLG